MTFSVMTISIPFKDKIRLSEVFREYIIQVTHCIEKTGNTSKDADMH
jgi:hypothetical protein